MNPLETHLAENGIVHDETGAKLDLSSWTNGVIFLYAHDAEELALLKLTPSQARDAARALNRAAHFAEGKFATDPRRIPSGRPASAVGKATTQNAPNTDRSHA